MPYPLRTPRLRIEPLTERDVPAFVAYRRDPDVARWQGWHPTFSEYDAFRLLAAQPATELPSPGRWIQLAIHDLDAVILYGDVAVRRIADQPGTFEIGVTLAPTAQGLGFGTEAVTRVMHHLFADAGAHRLLACCDARNVSAANLLRRVGMRHESRQIEADYFKGEWTTIDGYAVLAREQHLRRA